jgi:hypothetical protein
MLLRGTDKRGRRERISHIYFIRGYKFSGNFTDSLRTWRIILLDSDINQQTNRDTEFQWRVLFPGIWCSVVWQEFTDVSTNVLHTSSGSKSKLSSVWSLFLLVWCFVYFYFLKMEALFFFWKNRALPELHENTFRKSCYRSFLSWERKIF